MSVKSQFNIDERAEVKSVSSVNSMVGSDVDVDVLLCIMGIIRTVMFAFILLYPVGQRHFSKRMWIAVHLFVG